MSKHVRRPRLHRRAALLFDPSWSRLEIETCRQCVERGIVPPVWNSANAPGGDEKNAAYLKKYKPLVKCL